MLSKPDLQVAGHAAEMMSPLTLEQAPVQSIFKTGPDRRKIRK
jgi:hypothetical protein